MNIKPLSQCHMHSKMNVKPISQYHMHRKMNIRPISHSQYYMHSKMNIKPITWYHMYSQMNIDPISWYLMHRPELVKYCLLNFKDKSLSLSCHAIPASFCLPLGLTIFYFLV